MHVPLRVHSVYSRGRGGVTVGEAAAWLEARRVPAAALTDLGNLYGWDKWKRAAAAAGGFRPLFGCELEVGGRRFVFLVKERAGYWNLMEIFNRREVRDLTGLVTIYVPPGDGTSGANDAAAEWNSAVAGGDERDRQPVLNDRNGHLGESRQNGAPAESENISSIGGPAQDVRSRGNGKKRRSEGTGTEPAQRWPGWPSEEAMLAELREKAPAGDLYLGADFANFERVAEMGLPVVWANPLKYVAGPERLVLLHAIERKVPYPPERDRLAATLGLFGPDQEALAIRRFGAAVRPVLARNAEVAAKCAFVFDDIVPPLPADLFPHPLREVVMGRLAAARDLSWRARQRARRELEAVEASGFGPYFLVVHDVVEFARRRGILHNLRGSGASSFLAYLLGISHVNPLEFDLYFERFLNRGRPDPPDIDLDFDSRFRDEVLAYVLKTYGAGKSGAAFVCSLKDFGARSALYETLRAFGAPPDEARGLTKRIPYFADPDYLRRDAPATGYLDAWKLAAGLQDVYHEISLHVGGVILTPAPVERTLPLETSAKGLRMTHFDKDAVEDLRLIKLDLLSVRGLAAISETKTRLKLRAVPPGDLRTYTVLRGARTVGCFQVESPAMMNLLRRMKPETVHELTQALALVRPGPTESGMKEALLRRRSGAPVTEDAFLARILPETGGILLYEEQVMQVAERVAGFPPEEGDLLRRSLKRKGGDPRLREKFYREAGERGYGAAEVERLWRTMEKFSSYSFNKAHSASYAYMAYQAVYLKTHHPVPYFAAVFNAGGGYYELPVYVEEAKRNGIRVLPPDVNRSLFAFEVESAGPAGNGGGAIRVGFSSIKGLAEKTIERLIEERRTGGDYASVGDFLTRIEPGKAELLSLIRAGVFDSLEPRRTRQVLRYFQGLEDMTEVADIAPSEKRRMLYESLGFLPEGDPLDLYEGKRPDLRIKDLVGRAGTLVELVVRVVDARQKGTAHGAKYFYLFEDETGLLEGAGEGRCVTYGTPPVCFLRGEVRRDGEGVPKISNCAFLRTF